MRILVTGGAGYIGSHTAKLLATSGHEPIVFDDLSQGHEWAVKWGPLERGSLADRARLADVFSRYDIDGVVHFAASALVGESMTNPGRYFENNTVGTLNLLEAMRAAGVGRLVFSSTCATYGNPVHVPIDETHPQAPVNPYGESKLMVEKMFRWYGEIHGLRWMALRYFNAAGADPDGEIGEDHDPESHLIPLVIGAALGTRPPVKIFGTDYPTPDGTAVRDYIHVADLADAHLRALDRLGAGEASQAINLGTGTRPLGARSRRHRCSGQRPAGPGPGVTTPRRRSRGAGCGARARAPGARLDGPARGARDDRAARLGVAPEAPVNQQAVVQVSRHSTSAASRGTALERLVQIQAVFSLGAPVRRAHGPHARQPRVGLVARLGATPDLHHGLLGLPSDGERHDALLGAVGAFENAGQTAFVHDGDPVAEVEDLLHVAADHHDRHAAAARPRNSR